MPGCGGGFGWWDMPSDQGEGVSMNGNRRIENELFTQRP